MNRQLASFAALLLLVACGGSKGDSSTTGTAQGAARLWLQAAVSRNDGRCAELSTDDFREKSAGFAAQIRERFESGAEFRWGGSGKEGADYSWTAAGPGGVVFFKVREVSTGEFRVSDVQTSW